jgi:hypothetical protein
MMSCSRHDIGSRYVDELCVLLDELLELGMIASIDCICEQFETLDQVGRLDASHADNDDDVSAGESRMSPCQGAPGPFIEYDHLDSA